VDNWIENIIQLPLIVLAAILATVLGFPNGDELCQNMEGALWRRQAIMRWCVLRRRGVGAKLTDGWYGSLGACLAHVVHLIGWALTGLLRCLSLLYPWRWSKVTLLCCMRFGARPLMLVTSMMVKLESTDKVWTCSESSVV
jgi:hypothetical protein